MKPFSSLFLLLILLASCNSHHSNNDKAKKDSIAVSGDQPASQTPSLSGCYLRVLQRDSLVLKLEQYGNNFTGKLTFDNFEKDGSTGIVKGTLTGDILKLIYDFQSEGMQSVMEVYFKVVDGGLIHGIGEVNVRSDTTYFPDNSQINYPESNKLSKVSCESLASKYK